MSFASTTSDDLELRWRALTIPAGDHLAAERVRDWAGGAVLVALDSSGGRHLLVGVSEGREIRLPRRVIGLQLAVRDLHPPSGPDAAWLVLSLEDPSGDRPFAGLCADIVSQLPTEGSDDPVTVLAVIERWRRFWASSRDGLTRDEQLGLFGELWLLLKWLPELTLAAITAWQGPLRGRHDFVSAAVSVEVKTTGSSTGPVVHRVTRLDQLDEPGAGKLYLLSLRVIRDPSGPDSLDALLRRARAVAATTGPMCAAVLDDRLRAVGVDKEDEGRYVEPVRVAQQELYDVRDGFPRLTSSSFVQGLPPGVVDLSYSLDTSACRPWLLTNTPDGMNPVAVLS